MLKTEFCHNSSNELVIFITAKHCMSKRIYFLVLVCILFCLKSTFVKAQVPAVISVSGSSFVCLPSPTVGYSYSAQTINSPTSFTWSVTGGAAFTSTGNVMTVYFPGQGSYTITVQAQNSNGISPLFTQVVTVFNAPNVSFSGATTVCSGSSTFIQASSTNVSGSSTVLYNWNPPNFSSINSPINSAGYIFASSSTIYTVTANNNGCTTTSFLPINVSPVPNVFVSPSSGVPICQGGSVVLTAVVSNPGSTTLSYNWSALGGLNTTTGSVVTATPNQSSLHQVLVSNGACIGIGNYYVTVLPTPIITVIGSNSGHCNGGSTALQASATLQSGSSTIFYTWSPANSLNTNQGANVVSNTTANAIYTVTGTTNSGCSSTATAQVTVYPIPVISVAPSSTAVCAGNPVTFNATGGYSYTYSPIQIVDNYPFIFMNTGLQTVTVSGRSLANCVGTATTQVLVKPSPTVSGSVSSPTICSGSNSTITVSGSAGSTFQVNGNPITGNGLVISPTVTTNYIVGASLNGCNATSNVLQTVDPCIGIQETKADKLYELSVYPNPNSGRFSIRSSTAQSLLIFNELGQLVRKLEMRAEEEQVIEQLTQGIYFIQGHHSRYKLVVLSN
jgi:trimeric autotransporter adhesin